MKKGVEVSSVVLTVIAASLAVAALSVAPYAPEAMRPAFYLVAVMNTVTASAFWVKR